jgi:hypothetical protein
MGPKAGFESCQQGQAGDRVLGLGVFYGLWRCQGGGHGVRGSDLPGFLVASLTPMTFLRGCRASALGGRGVSALRMYCIVSVSSWKKTLLKGKVWLGKARR